MGFLCIPFLFLPSAYIRLPAKIWITFIFFLLKTICKITYQIKGLEKVPKEPLIIVSKHQSAFETFALYYHLKNSFFIHKKQLYYIPVFGQYLLKANMVAINRKGKSSAMIKMIHEVKNKIDKGSSVIIFPEGTRKKPGEKTNYKTGFIGIYKEVKRKILPVALNSGLFWPKRPWIMREGNIIIQFLDCLPANLKREEILNIVENNIEDASNKLLN